MNPIIYIFVFVTRLQALNLGNRKFIIMETEKKEVVICLGSSCFARGNKQLVKIVNDYLRDRNLLNEVRFHGERCFGQCAVGPSLKLGGILKEKLDEDSVIEVMDEFFETIGK